MRLSPSIACVLKLNATSRNPAMAPDVMACTILIMSHKAKSYDHQYPYKTKVYIYKPIITFNLGIVTVGGAALAWKPIAFLEVNKL
jgi:hypothetical protein